MGSKATPSSPARKTGGSRWQRRHTVLTVLGVVVAVGGLLALTTCNRSLPEPLPPTAARTSLAPANPLGAVAAAAGATDAEMQALRGRWQRPDGGYVLDVREVEAGGRVVAAYYNPRPINVARAQATRSEGATRLFIELQDEGYPGCTYHLAYIPGSDLLRGKYYQAALRQEFDVVFGRLRP